MNLYEKYENFAENSRIEGLLGRKHDISIGDGLNSGGGGGGGGIPIGRMKDDLNLNAFALSRNVEAREEWRRLMDQVTEATGEPPDWFKGDADMWNDGLVRFMENVEDLLGASDTQSIMLVISFMNWMSQSFLSGVEGSDNIRSLLQFLRQTDGALIDLIGGSGSDAAFFTENAGGVLRFVQNPSGGNSSAFSQSYLNMMWTIMQYVNNLNVPF